MLAAVRGAFEQIVITRYAINPRGGVARAAAGCLPGGGAARPRVAESPAAALRLARSLAGAAAAWSWREVFFWPARSGGQVAGVSVPAIAGDWTATGPTELRPAVAAATLEPRRPRAGEDGVDLARQGRRDGAAAVHAGGRHHPCGAAATRAAARPLRRWAPPHSPRRAARPRSRRRRHPGRRWMVSRLGRRYSTVVSLSRPRPSESGQQRLHGALAERATAHHRGPPGILQAGGHDLAGAGREAVHQHRQRHACERWPGGRPPLVEHGAGPGGRQPRPRVATITPSSRSADRRHRRQPGAGRRDCPAGRSRVHAGPAPAAIASRAARTRRPSARRSCRSADRPRPAHPRASSPRSRRADGGRPARSPPRPPRRISVTSRARPRLPAPPRDRAWPAAAARRGS